MEKLLLKMARQLNGLDEASLMSLWDKYSALVQRFEPSKRWEEQVLVFSFIQSMRWKNQLFNCRWAAGLAQERKGHPVAPVEHSPIAVLEDMEPPKSESSESGGWPAKGNRLKAGAKVLAFRPPKDDQST